MPPRPSRAGRCCRARQAKGLPQEPARALAARLVADPATALDTLAREELGVNPEELGGSAWEAAFTLLTGRSVWYSGMRQVLVGLAAAAITFGIGRLIGISLGG